MWIYRYWDDDIYIEFVSCTCLQRTWQGHYTLFHILLNIYGLTGKRKLFNWIASYYSKGDENVFRCLVIFDLRNIHIFSLHTCCWLVDFPPFDLPSNDKSLINCGIFSLHWKHFRYTLNFNMNDKFLIVAKINTKPFFIQN